MTAVFTPEAAGMNGMEELIVAADTGLPVLDCDAMGRAFPGTLPSMCKKNKNIVS